ncbi:MAG: hypothetical protein ACREQV_25075 [Candidatus Binatia bacterium]
MPAPAIASVEVLRVAAVQPLHAAGDVRERHRGDQVVVVAYEDELVKDPAKALDRGGEQDEELEAIVGVFGARRHPDDRVGAAAPS